MSLQFMKIYRSLLYMDLSGNEYKLYNYFLDKWQNILSANSKATEILHSEGQIQIAKKLHMTRATVQNCLNSLKSKGLVEICSCKELGNINSYKMTDITETEIYKKLDDKYKYEYKTDAEKRAERTEKKQTQRAVPEQSNRDRVRREKIVLELEVDSSNSVVNFNHVYDELGSYSLCEHDFTTLYIKSTSVELFVNYLEKLYTKIFDFKFKYV